VVLVDVLVVVLVVVVLVVGLVVVVLVVGLVVVVLLVVLVGLVVELTSDVDAGGFVLVENASVSLPAHAATTPTSNSVEIWLSTERKFTPPFLLCSHVVRVCFSTGTFRVIFVSNVPTPSKGPIMNAPLNPQNRRSKRSTIIGATAGLLGGAGVGLLFAVPSLTSAASDDSSTAVDATAVVQQDDTSTETETDTEIDADVTEVEPGVRLRETLQALVDDGTITAEQADAVTAHLVANRPEGRPGHGGFGHGGFGRRGHGGFDGEVVSGLLGIDAETLRTELQAGKSIADIATEQGVDVQTVIDALVAEAQEHIDLMVENGRLTDEEAATKLADVTERITERVNTARPASD
jgi:polyhydroxyalkanoate synthesis regulator phasin